MIFSFAPSPFLWIRLWKEKRFGTSYHSFFGLQNMFRKIPFLVINHLCHFDNLIKSNFWVIQKNTFANLCKRVHDAIAIRVSSDPFNLGTVERKEKRCKKNQYFENENSFLDKIKIIFHNFWSAFSWLELIRTEHNMQFGTNRFADYFLNEFSWNTPLEAVQKFAWRWQSWLRLHCCHYYLNSDWHSPAKDKFPVLLEKKAITDCFHGN